MEADIDKFDTISVHKITLTDCIETEKLLKAGVRGTTASPGRMMPNKTYQSQDWAVYIKKGGCLWFMRREEKQIETSLDWPLCVQSGDEIFVTGSPDFRCKVEKIAKKLNKIININ